MPATRKPSSPVGSGEGLLAALDGLDPPDGLAIQLLEQMTSGGESAGVDAGIASDPVLALRLRVPADRDSSVSHGGGGGPATTDPRGARRSALIALLAEALDGFEPLNEFRCGLWRHAIAVACSAARGSAGLDGVSADQAFAAGLLHDLGKLALSACAPRSVARVLRTAEETGVDLIEIEQHELGLDHAAAGHRLALRWGLPTAVVETAWLHHHPPALLPSAVSHRDLIELVQIADLVAREEAIGLSGNPVGGEDRVARAALLGLSAELAAGLSEGLAQETDRYAAAAGLALGAESLGPGGDAAHLAGALARRARALAGEQAETATRARALEAVRDFTAAAVRCRSVREACVAAARALGSALGLNAAVVFADADPSWVEVGAWDSNGGSADLVPRAVDPRAAADDQQRLADSAAPDLHEIPAALRDLARRYARRIGAGRAWLLPLVHEGRWVGGCFVSITEAGLPDLRAKLAAAAGCGLPGIVADGLARRTSQADADRRTEQFADAVRRAAQPEQALQQAEGLKITTELAAGAAHELHTPLAVISGRAQVLRDQAADPAAREALEAIVEQARRCSEIIAGLHEIGRPPLAYPSELDVREVLPRWAASWIEQFGLEASQLELEISDELCPVFVDADLVSRILEELVRNAVEATDPRDRRLAIKARRHPTDEAVALTVRDNGRGMTRDVQERAFVPFFSQRPAGRGRGLGLAWAAGWTSAIGGRLRTMSRPGAGTTVELTLPAGRR